MRGLLWSVAFLLWDGEADRPGSGRRVAGAVLIAAGVVLGAVVLGGAGR